MPATALDSQSALVVIDLQKGLAKMPTLAPFADVVANTVRLARAFRAKGLPVVLVNVMASADGKDLPHTRTETAFRLPPMPDFGELVPELEPQATDLRITKRQPSAFYGTELDLQLRRRGISGIVLTGISTSSGVDATARAAHERSYNVTFATDAITDVDADAQATFLRKVFPRVGELDTTDAILALLDR